MFLVHKNHLALSGEPGRVVGGANDRKAIFGKQSCALGAETVIAAGKSVHSGVQHLLDGFCGESHAVRKVLGIGNDKIRCVFFTPVRQDGGYPAPPDLPHNIADEEDFHSMDYSLPSTD